MIGVEELTVLITLTFWNRLKQERSSGFCDQWAVEVTSERRSNLTYDQPICDIVSRSKLIVYGVYSGPFFSS